MRTLAMLALGIALATPAAAQDRAAARNSYVIGLDELLPLGTIPVRDAIGRLRPRFLTPYPTAHSRVVSRTGVQSVARPWRLLVVRGADGRPEEEALLDHYRTDEVAEIRYFRVTDAAARFGTDNASVIQLVPREPRRD